MPHIPGSEKIDEVSSALSLPEWWIKLVIIEYLNCRHFFRRGEIWSFDFNLLSRSDWKSIGLYKVVIPSSSILIHNISVNEFQSRLINSMTGERSPPLKNQEIVVEGLAHMGFFPQHFNSFTSWDPKLAFGDYCIVLSGGYFYQWKIAESFANENSNVGWWRSDFLNLDKLEMINFQIEQLRNKFAKKEILIEKARRKAQFLYGELERLRQPIREKILDYHYSKIKKMAQRDTFSNDLTSGYINNKESSLLDDTVIRYRGSHYTHRFEVPIEEAFRYFGDVDAYSTRYSTYCKNVTIISSTDHSLRTKEFWNISIGADIDHVILEVLYRFVPPTRIYYEIIGGYIKGIGIQNLLVLNKTKSNSTIVKINNPLLDIICYPPHSIKPGMRFFTRYMDMIEYFLTSDLIHLEKKSFEYFKAGQTCSKCKKGSLSDPRTVEEYTRDDFRRKIVLWKCNYCGFAFKGCRIDVADGFVF